MSLLPFCLPWITIVVYFLGKERLYVRVGGAVAMDGGVERVQQQRAGFAAAACSPGGSKKRQKCCFCKALVPGRHTVTPIPVHVVNRTMWTWDVATGLLSCRPAPIPLSPGEAQTNADSSLSWAGTNTAV